MSHLVSGYEFEHGTIFDRLDHGGIDWQIYEGDEFPVSWAFANVNVGDITDMEDFYSELFEEDFSYRYVFIEPKYDMRQFGGITSPGATRSIRSAASPSVKCSLRRFILFSATHPTGRKAPL